MSSNGSYRPASLEVSSSISRSRRKALPQGRISSQQLIPDDSTIRRPDRDSFADYELPQHVIDRISELERSKSTRAEVVERRDVIRHPTQGPDPTSSPRRDPPPQECQKSVAVADDLLALSDDSSQDGGGGGAPVNLVRARRADHDVPRHLISGNSVRRRDQAAVLLVDATDVRDPHQSGEVDVKTSIITSPVSVVRHGPPRTSSARNVDCVKDEILVDLADAGIGNEDVRPRMDYDVESNAGLVTAMKDLEIAPLEEEVNENEDDADDASFAKKRRKVKRNIVPSRYMQTKKQAITSTSSISSKSADFAAKAKKSLSRTLLGSSTQRSVFQSTPYDRHGFVRHQHHPDLSAIDAPREVARLNLDDSEMGSRWESTKAVGKQIAESSKLSGQRGSSKSKTKTTSSKLSRHAVPSPALTQGQLDLLEARVSQWVYLETLARKAAQDQEKEAHTQLYSVWSENERIRQQIHELESKILQYRYEEELDKAVDEQLAALDPVVSQLTAVKSEYPRLALALDTTRHQLPVHDLHLPENQDDLLNALGESENLLGDLSALIRRRQSKIKDFSQTMQALENAVNVEEKDAERCREFLAACGSLQLQRSSYVVQDVQMKKEKDSEC